MEYLNDILPALVAFFFVQRLAPTNGVRQITIAELKKELQDKNKQYLDVRTPGEFKVKNMRALKIFLFIN